MAITVYGIPNCDTVKRARAWLDEHGTGFVFHDYKRAGVGETQLRGWVARLGWETLMNRAGTTFRKLDEADRTGLDADKAIALMIAHPSLIRRPVVEYGAVLLVGFRPNEWIAAGLGEGKA